MLRALPLPRGRRRGHVLLAVLAALFALRVATYSQVVGVSAVPPFLRAAGAAVLLFGLCGFGLTRLTLPDGLRRHEWLWILPVGAVASAFAMAPLGYVGVPYEANLGVVVAGGAATSLLALRRLGLPPRPELAAIGWPVYLAVLLLLIALVPLFRAGFATVIGSGSDAHLAAGTAEFLKHARPGTVDPTLPVDQVPLVWRSKPPIYYPFAAVSTIAGLETYEVLSVLTVLLLTLAAVGWFVFARETLGGSVGTAALAMAIAGLDRIVIHTGVHPYFNQTWGYMTVPFLITLSWWVIRHPSGGGIALLALFMVVCGFAYPLALPIPALVLAVMWAVSRRQEGKRLRSAVKPAWRRLQALPRRARWPLYLVALLLVPPLFGVWEKVDGGLRMLIDTNYSLAAWGGDLQTWIPERYFFAIQPEDGWWVALIVIAAFAARELWRLPKPARYGLLGVVVTGALVAAEMRVRDYGYYFHFKMLAFVAPLVVVLAVAGMTRPRRESPRRWMRPLMTVALAVWALWAVAGARDEVSNTYDQLPRSMLALRDWSQVIPAGSSIRLDMEPAAQLWPAYLLADHRVCSERPLTNTSYPHVPISRAADFALVRYRPRPADVTGEPLIENQEFQLYRLRPALPGGDRCSRQMVQTVEKIERG